MNLSTKNITFLRHVPTDVKVSMRIGWRLHYFEEFSLDVISSFLDSIKDDNTYLLIPKFSTSQSLSIGALEFSEPFLVNKNSNPVLITKFILNQWNSSGFGLKDNHTITFSFKWKKVWFINI